MIRNTGSGDANLYSSREEVESEITNSFIAPSSNTQSSRFIRFRFEDENYSKITPTDNISLYLPDAERSRLEKKKIDISSAVVE